MAETRQRRNRFLWPTTQALFLFLPLIVAAARFEASLWTSWWPPTWCSR